MGVCPSHGIDLGVLDPVSSIFVDLMELDLLELNAAVSTNMRKPSGTFQ